MSDGPDSKAGRNVPADFLPLARSLRKWQDKDPEYMPVVAALAGISRRTAYALARIDRVFGRLPVPPERLLQLGWTRLDLLAPYVDDANVEELLALAGQVTTHELDVLLRGGQVVDGTRCFILRLAPKHYELVEAVLLEHGAVRVGSGLAGKEQALVTALAKLRDPE